MATFTPPTTEQWKTLYDLPDLQETPSAMQTLSGFALDEQQLRQHIADSRNLSVYVHVPFCRQLCSFCNCSIVVTRQYGLASQYVDMLNREIRWFGEALCNTPALESPLEKLYIGGGTPTFLMSDDLQKISASLANYFGQSHSSERDYCIEIDPRLFDADTAELLAQLGFNRVHFGLEDFNTQVQQAVNRKYTVERIQQSVTLARNAGLKQVSIDLLYGLPEQTLATFNATLKQVARMQPSRVFLRQFKYQPCLYPAQKTLDATQLPNRMTLLDQQASAINFWQTQGYALMGTDGFVRKGDPLHRAAQTNQLHYNHRDYCAHRYDSQLGLGMAAVSHTPNAIWQNQSNLRDYIKQVLKLQQAAQRGLPLNQDDQIRRELTEKLLSNQLLKKTNFKDRYSTEFDDYFRDELTAIDKIGMNDLIDNTTDYFCLSEMGRWYARQIAALFDSAHL